MDAKELMIGDWVQFHHTGIIKVSDTAPKYKSIDVLYIGEVEGVYVGVNNGIGQCGIKTLPNDYEPQVGHHMLHAFAIEPIRITEEILKKNGMDGLYGDIWPVDEYPHIELTSKGDEISWTINFNEYDIMPFEYVHELQHALRLCDIDKQIIL